MEIWMYTKESFRNGSYMGQHRGFFLLFKSLLINNCLNKNHNNVVWIYVCVCVYVCAHVCKMYKTISQSLGKEK